MKKNYKILITWRLLVDDILKFKLLFKKNNIHYDIVHNKQFVSENVLKKIISRYDGLICGDDEITKKVLNKANNLKVISKWGTGLDSIDLNYAKKKSIKVFNSPGAFTDNVSDHALALMFSLTRNIVNNHYDIKNGIWSKRLCENLSNKTIGIIGYGKIGKMIKKKLSGFKVNFLINDINNKEIYYKSKALIYKKSDIIFLCVDLNETSKNLIGNKQLLRMKRNALLINICRGQVINSNDLYNALKNKLIGGAGLDVHYHEPIKKNNKFLKLKNCIMSSHNAFNSRETIFQINAKTVSNLILGLCKKNI